MKSTLLTLVLVALLLGVCAVVCTAEDKAPSVEVHGYMQNRIYLAPGANAQFRSERISLSAKGNLPENSNAYVEVYYHPWAPGSGLYLESAYYDRPVWDGRIRIGKGRLLAFGMTPAYPNRKTSNYGIVAETFTQDRVQGIQYYQQKEVLDFSAAVYTAPRLGTRAVGEIPGDSERNADHQVPHLAFRDLPGSLSQKLQYSTRVGGNWGGLKAGASYALGTLDERDVTSLTTDGSSLAPGGTPALLPATATDDSISVLGLDARYQWPSGWLLQGEWYDGSLGDLDVTAWNVLGGVQLPNGWKAFARYSVKDMGVIATANPLSWDLRQTSLSVVQPLSKGPLWLQYEYEINDEKTPAGVSGVSNNLFFVELFAAF